MLARGLALAVGLLVLVSAAAPAQAEPRTLQLRSTEDPAVPNVPPGCPFDAPNVRLGATLWSMAARATDAELVNEQVHQVGTASACGRITDFSFTPGSRVPFYIEFTLEDGVYAAEGECTVTSNDVPVPRLILAGCALRVTAAPDGVAGGLATSASVFNPFRLAGFATGSYWTLHVYPRE